LKDWPPGHSHFVLRRRLQKAAHHLATPTPSPVISYRPSCEAPRLKRDANPLTEPNRSTLVLTA
jgi:hypothetical protein